MASVFCLFDVFYFQGCIVMVNESQDGYRIGGQPTKCCLIYIGGKPN